MSLRTLATHAQRYRELREQLNKRIGEEWAKGSTMADIAAAVGLSRQRVHQIIVEMAVAKTLPKHIDDKS